MSVEGEEFVSFYPCSTAFDLDNKPFSYKPLFVHHFFTPKFRFECYKSLDIRFFYTVDTLYTHLTVCGEFNENVAERNIPYHLLELEKAIFTNVPFPEGFLSRAQFLKKLNSRSELKFAINPVHEFKFEDGRLMKLYSIKPEKDKSVNDVDDVKLEKSTKFSVSKKKFTLIEYEENFTIGNNTLLHLHRRAEWYCHWFIESFSNIIYDQSWEIFFPIICPFKSTSPCNSLENPSTSGPEAITNRDTYHLIGLVTCYRFFTINLKRLRISQFFIFPQWQSKGLGIEILKTIYLNAIKDDEIKEITVEDPAPSFAILRNVVGLQLCLEMGLITEKHFGPNKLKSITVQDISQTCKESKGQASRLLEILSLAAIKVEDNNNCSSQEYSAVRLRAKKRMKIENEDLLASVPNYKELLQKMWEEKFMEYIRSINKVRKLCGKRQLV